MEFKAKIERKSTPLSKTLTTIWILIVVAAIVIGFFVASEFRSYTKDEMYIGGKYVDIEPREVSYSEIGIFLTFYRSYTENGGTSAYFREIEFIVELAAVIVLFAIPIVIKAIRRAWCRRLSLTLHEDRVTGTYGKFSTKSLSLPIEQLSSVSVIESFLDKVRSGKTISIRSASGVIAFPFVQNADEFAQKSLEAINKYKGERRIAPAAAPVASASNADELKKYKDLLDSGVITEEEFNAKKKQILGL